MVWPRETLMKGRRSLLLKVANIHFSDVYKDMARVPEAYRRTPSEVSIPEGTICRVYVGKKSRLLSLRGQTEHGNPAIHIDERTRTALGVRTRETHNFNFCPVGFWGQFNWAWNAADPAYRIATRMGAVAVGLGVIGLVISILPMLSPLLNTSH